MSVADVKNGTEVFTPGPEEGPDGQDALFLGPLMSDKVQKDDLIRFIQGKYQDCLQHLDDPDQQKSYFFWMIMENFCNGNDDLGSRGLIYASHICYVVAQMVLGSRRRFHVIGYDWVNNHHSVPKEVIERTEIYEYVLSLTPGVGQPHFQEFKYLYACDLADAGLCAQVLETSSRSLGSSTATLWNGL